MPEETEFAAMREIIRKAAMYDLLKILEEEPDRVYTVPELKLIIRGYIAGKET